jgi:lipopolysaccharide/colanic/teichoic acid biosynthesis glycosyltransferase
MNAHARLRAYTLPVLGRPDIVPVGWTRRGLDVVVSLIALIVLAPLMAMIAGSIRTLDRVPSIFRQDRVGQGGRIFTVFKFRTMGPAEGGPEVTGASDPRVTPLGRVLRALSLDELPQLANVLAGTMTLVGPRPETPRLASAYPPWCREVFRYRPGLTGPGPIRFRDGDVLHGSDEDRYLAFVVPARVRADLEYLAAPTIARTLAVIAQTIGHVVRFALGRRLP